MKLNKFGKSIIAQSLILLLVFGAVSRAQAQAVFKSTTFEKIEMLSPEGEKIREIDVRVRFNEDSLEIESANTNKSLKKWNYADIESAEYSYTKNPRWKTGIGLGAASVIFPPLLLIAIPIGFSKHRRHWLTVRTGNDYAVLKLSKNNRKLFIPAFETYSSVRIRAFGDDK